MRFIKAKAVDGIPQVGFCTLYEAKGVAGEAVAYVEGNIENDVILGELTVLEYLAHWNAGKAQVNKPIINVSSSDVAIITVETHPDLSEIVFYNVDTGEIISTAPIDQATHTATLQVTATTPGVIHIRAGEPTITRLNEVIINAT